MFARMSSYALPDGAESSADLALTWIELQNSQSVVARRQRLNCPPFQSHLLGSPSQPIGTSQSSSKHHHHSSGAHGSHRMLTVCAARRSSRHHSKREAPNHRLLRHQALIKAYPQPARGAQPDSQLRPQQQSQAPQQQQAPHQQQQQHASIDPQQLAACIQAATTFSQLQAVCNTFLGHTAFTAHHAALVLSRLHLVSSRPTDSHLLLVELLSQLLPSGCCLQQHAATARCSAGGASVAQSQQQQQQQQAASCQDWLSCGEVAAVCWAFARSGYQPGPQLLQQLLQQFWLAFGQQQQQQQQDLQRPDPAAVQQQHQPAQQVSAPSSAASGTTQQQQQNWPPSSPDEALATLVAGLAGLGCREASWWCRIRAAVQVSLSACSSQGLPVHSLQQLAWGFAAVQQADAATVGALAAALQGRLGELETPEDLVQSMWSLHLMGCVDSSLFQQAAAHMVQRLQAGGGGGSSSGGGSTSSGVSRHNLVPTAGGAARERGRAVQAAPAGQATPVLPQLPSSGSGCVAGSNSAGQQQQQPGLSTLPQQQQQQQRQQTQRVQGSGASSPQRLLTAAASQTAARCSAAASQALGALNQYDPLLCMLALYRDYHRPAHSL